MKKRTYIIIGIIFIVLLCIGVLCSVFEGKNHSNDSRNNNLAKIEVYSNNELIKVINNEKTLYDYNNTPSFYEDYEENQEDLKIKAKELEEEYSFISYKAPVAIIGSNELEKIMTITLYKNSNIIKMTASSDSVKNFSLPEEFLTFYYEISNEDLQFFYSLIKN